MGQELGRCFIEKCCSRNVVELLVRMKTNMIELDWDDDDKQPQNYLKKRFYAIIVHKKNQLKSKIKKQKKSKKRG
ncbi:MAG: hypothetical protein ACKPA7_18360, partial [Sphaerospermopsis kisseleviana]